MYADTEASSRESRIEEEDSNYWGSHPNHRPTHTNGPFVSLVTLIVPLVTKHKEREYTMCNTEDIEYRFVKQSGQSVIQESHKSKVFGKPSMTKVFTLQEVQNMIYAMQAVNPLAVKLD